MLSIAYNTNTVVHMYNLQIYALYIMGVYIQKMYCVSLLTTGSVGKEKRGTDGGACRSCEEFGLFSVPWEGLEGFEQGVQDLRVLAAV